jgi:hypothetical protein
MAYLFFKLPPFGKSLVLVLAISQLGGENGTPAEFALWFDTRL